jgi:hypothetical protein
MAANFDKYLDVDVESIEKPEPPPIGHYYVDIKDWKTGERDYDKSNGGPKTPVAELQFVNFEPSDDVDPSDLEAWGRDLSKVRGTKDFRIAGDEAFGIRAVGENICGINVKGLKLRDLLNELKGQRVKVATSHRVDKNDENNVYLNIDKVLKAE